MKLGEAPSHGKPITLYDNNSIGAVRYSELAQEVLGVENLDHKSFEENDLRREAETSPEPETNNSVISE